MKPSECLKTILGDLRVYSALDVGCGTGSFTRTLADMLGEVQEIVGVDPDKDSLDEARELTSDNRISYRLFSGYAMPYEPGRFDLVAISNALHHVPEPERLLRLMAEVLAPDGWFVVQELASDGLSSAEENGRDVHHFKAQIDRLAGQTHNRTFTRDEIRRLITDAGLTVDAECDIVDLLTIEPNDGELAERVSHAQTFLPEYLEHARDTLAYRDLERESRRLLDSIAVHGIATPPRLLIRARRA